MKDLYRESSRLGYGRTGAALVSASLELGLRRKSVSASANSQKASKTVQEKKALDSDTKVR